MPRAVLIGATSCFDWELPTPDNDESGVEERLRGRTLGTSFLDFFTDKGIGDDFSGVGGSLSWLILVVFVTGKDESGGDLALFGGAWRSGAVVNLVFNEDGFGVDLAGEGGSLFLIGAARIDEVGSKDTIYRRGSLGVTTTGSLIGSNGEDVDGVGRGRLGTDEPKPLLTSWPSLRTALGLEPRNSTLTCKQFGSPVYFPPIPKSSGSVTGPKFFSIIRVSHLASRGCNCV